MEFLVFALLNLVTGLVLYVLFSLRMQAQQDKIRAAHPLQKETAENIRQGVQAMNAALEEMQEIRANFYQIVRHAEEVAARLEEGQKKSGRKKRAESQQDTRPLHHNPEPREEDPHLSRLLDRMGPDRVDLTPPAREPEVRSAPVPETPSANIIQGIGRFAASLFGVKTEPLNAIGEANAGAASAARKETLDGMDRRRVAPAAPAPVFIEPPNAASLDQDLPPPAGEAVRLPSASDQLDAPSRDPNAWIRSLLAGGMKPADVSRVTGRSLAEIDLISSLPLPAAAPRRKKLGE